MFNARLVREGTTASSSAIVEQCGYIDEHIKRILDNKESIKDFYDGFPELLATIFGFAKRCVKLGDCGVGHQTQSVSCYVTYGCLSTCWLDSNETKDKEAVQRFLSPGGMLFKLVLEFKDEEMYPIHYTQTNM